MIAKDEQFPALPSIESLLRKGMQTPGSPVHTMAVEVLRKAANEGTMGQFLDTFDTFVSLICSPAAPEARGEQPDEAIHSLPGAMINPARVVL